MACAYVSQMGDTAHGAVLESRYLEVVSVWPRVVGFSPRLPSGEGATRAARPRGEDFIDAIDRRGDAGDLMNIWGPGDGDDGDGRGCSEY